LSVVSLVAPVLWLVGAAAAAVNFAALWQIGKSGARGRLLATVGLACSCFCGACGFTFYSYYDSVLHGQARAVAERWLEETLNGDFKIAYWLAQSPVNRLSNSPGTAQLPANSGGQTDPVQSYAEAPTISKLLGLRKTSDARSYLFDGVVGESRTPYSEQIKLAYQVTFTSSAGTQTLPILIALSREAKYFPRRVGWQVAVVQDEETPDQ